MTLYLYKIGTATPLMTMKEVAAYTADSAELSDGTIYGPFAENCELSGRADCSETLRADWRDAHPSEQTRIEELEALVAELLFGAEAGGEAE